MAFEVHPLTADRFDDFALVVNRTRRSSHCWCLSHRLSAREIDELGGGNREEAMRRLADGDVAAGVVAYRDGEPVGWCSISPRTAIPLLERSRLITPVDDLAAWCVICVVVRPGFRKQGNVVPMLDGAVEYAFANGAAVVEAYPVDPPGRMDLTMAFVGTKAMFAAAGFEQVGQTKAVASGLPRLVMRRFPR
jgi:hypothetical protein